MYELNYSREVSAPNAFCKGLIDSNGLSLSIDKVHLNILSTCWWLQARQKYVSKSE